MGTEKALIIHAGILPKMHPDAVELPRRRVPEGIFMRKVNSAGEAVASKHLSITIFVDHEPTEILQADLGRTLEGVGGDL